jgi:type III secretory pathway component EscS
VTAALTQTALFSIILLQIPTVIVMVIVGFLIGFWKVSYAKDERKIQNIRPILPGWS